MKAESFTIIKNKFPDQWILLGNPVSENGKFVSGVVVLHSHDKKEVCYLGKDKVKDYKRVTVVFTGEIKPQNRIGILKRI